MVGSNNSFPGSWIPYNVVYGLMLKLEIYNYVAGRSLYTGGFPFLHWQLLLKLSTIQLSPGLLQVMSFLRSSLIHFTCIGVVPIDWFRPLQRDKSRGSNSDADKMNQTQSRVFCSCHQLFRSHYMWVVNDLSEFYISLVHLLEFTELIIEMSLGKNNLLYSINLKYRNACFINLRI